MFYEQWLGGLVLLYWIGDVGLVLVVINAILEDTYLRTWIYIPMVMERIQLMNLKGLEQGVGGRLVVCIVWRLGGKRAKAEMGTRSGRQLEWMR